jgi:hypothetical protein
MRKNEAYGRFVVEAQFGNDGHKIGAVGTQAVQPDHGKARAISSLDFNGRQQGI